MIKVCFPPGCYGTYFSRCLYNYTNLRIEPFIEFKFDFAGSSHSHRSNKQSKEYIIQCHIETLGKEDNNQVISIIPCTDHKLDYYNNQFFKQEYGKLIHQILSHVPQHEVEFKLKSQWNYMGKLDNNVPRWIMREWCSFWISDVLDQTYDPLIYQQLNSLFQLNVQNIFENWIETLTHAISLLGLTITVDIDIINRQHQEFVKLQKLHNSQNRCHQYVFNLLNQIDGKIIVHSIFDEAYIQHLLRQHNLEIQCDGLEIFPSTTQHLRTLTYEASNNSNQR
jgi:hypothetical protein